MYNLLQIYDHNGCFLRCIFKPLPYSLSSNIMARNQVEPRLTTFILDLDMYVKS